ncbi:MAG: winged helix-turn-helix domain-containing protein [Rubrivivax sp.]
MNAPPPLHALRFGRFELQPAERRLLADGQPLNVGARAFDLLLALAERPGRLVDKHTLMDLVWPGLVVQENNLAAQVSALRKLLGDGVVATIPGRGYRFVAALLHVPAPVPMPAGPAALRSNLPPGLRTLLGRDDDLAALAALVDRHRLVSVVGPGGVGKSLLTQHLLAARRTQYEHGVCWVDLAGVTDARALPGAVATALGVDAGGADAQAALRAALAPLVLLLALDNAEHLLDDVAALAAALHGAAPALRLVVTSQVPLHVAAEQVLRIGTLSVPDGPLPAAQAAGHGAVALFVERVRAADRHFRLDEGSVAATVDICRALDGLPLALELAAARVPALGLEPLRASLGERLALLSPPHRRDAPERQRTLRAALEWSHALLAPREQRVFRRLGVLAGPAPLCTLLALLVDADDDRWAVIDALDTLVDRSLLQALPAEAAAAGERLYRLLETPRAFALECLARAGEHDSLRRRHAQAMAQRFDDAYAQFFDGSTGVDAWTRERATDLPDARDALQWARQAGDGVAELRIAATLLRALVAALQAERLALADALEPRLVAPLPADLRARAWIEINCVLADTHKARSRHAAEQALALARALDAAQPDRFLLFHALCRAASAAAQDGDLPAARQRLAEAQPLEDLRWPAQRRVWRCEADKWLARAAGDNAAALRAGRQLRELERARGRHDAIALGNLIDLELAAGHADAAAALGHELVAGLRGTRDEFSLAFALINLLAAQLARDDVAGARPVAHEAWSHAARYELQHATAAYLALLAALERRPRAALLLAGYSEASYAARGEAREHNEATATQRARALARARMGGADAAALAAEGARLPEALVGPIAFAPHDAD